MSIAPAPGAPTGNQPAPMIDAGGGGQQPPRRPTAVGGPMPDDMRRELFSLPDREGNTFMTKPEGTQSQARGYANRMGRGINNQASEWGDNLKAFATKDKYKVGRRALYGGGAAAILGTILNMGDNKEEEEMVR